MKRAALYSALFHLIILLILSVGLPDPFDRKLADQRPLLIDFETIAPISMAPVLAPESSQDPEPEPEPLIEERAPPEPPPLAPPEPEPTPPEQVEVKEPEPTPEPTPPEVEEEPQPEEILVPEEKIPEKPKAIQPIEKPKKKPTPPKQKVELSLDKKEKKPEVDSKEKKKIQDDFADLLEAVKKDDKKDDKKKKTKSGIKGAPADQVGPVMTGTEIDAVRRTIARCWLVPNGARGAKDLVVVIQMKLAKDGTVTKAVIADMARYKTDPAFKAAADSARRAVLDPKCNPLPLPPEKYDQWKDIEMPFNPKDMY